MLRSRASSRATTWVVSAEHSRARAMLCKEKAMVLWPSNKRALEASKKVDPNSVSLRTSFHLLQLDRTPPDPGQILPSNYMMASLIDLSQPSLWLSAASIIFNPTFWNIVAQNEYYNKTITKLAGGNPRHGCYALAVTIFSLGLFRDALYERALRAQPSHPALLGFVPQAVAAGLVASGNVLVLSSMWALGVTGTYLGDYFGILMDHIVTGFPFNVTGSPMYWGSTMSFLGTALWYGKPAGVALTVLVFSAYYVALKFEDPFTAEIYAKRERERARGGAGATPKEGAMGPQGGVMEPKGGKTGPKRA
nr:phosphatidyl-n-methylethanolamine n-methyltransferase [Quercus suber]